MILIIDQEKCDGCGECVQACEAVRRSNSSSEGSCIRLIAFPDQGLWFPLVCQQCLDSPCGLTCPTGALSRDQAAPVVKLDRKRCVGCGMCLVSCPFGAIFERGRLVGAVLVGDVGDIGLSTGMVRCEDEQADSRAGLSKGLAFSCLARKFFVKAWTNGRTSPRPAA